MGRCHLRRATPWLVPVSLLVLWEIAADTGLLSARLLPAPSATARAAWEMLVSGVLAENVAISGQRALTGLTIGGGLGFLLGLLNAVVPAAERLLDSTVQMLRNIPHLAIIPLVILWFGIDEEAKLFLVAAGTLFPIYLNTFHGIRTVDRGLIEMARSYGLSKAALFWRIILPVPCPRSWWACAMRWGSCG